MVAVRVPAKLIKTVAGRYNVSEDAAFKVISGEMLKARSQGYSHRQIAYVVAAKAHAVFGEKVQVEEEPEVLTAQQAVEVVEAKMGNGGEYVGISLALDKVLTSDNFAATINYLLSLISQRRSKEMIRLEAGLPRSKETDKAFRVLNAKIRSGTVQLEGGAAAKAAPRNRKILVRELRKTYDQVQKFG